MKPCSQGQLLAQCVQPRKPLDQAAKVLWLPGKIRSIYPVPGIRDCCSPWPEPHYVFWGSMSLEGKSSARQHELHHRSPLPHRTPLANKRSS